MHSRCNSRAGETNRVPKGTGQGSVVAGFNPASTLLPSATDSDFAPKPYSQPDLDLQAAAAIQLTSSHATTAQLQLRHRSHCPGHNCNYGCKHCIYNCDSSAGATAAAAALLRRSLQPQLQLWLLQPCNHYICKHNLNSSANASTNIGNDMNDANASACYNPQGCNCCQKKLLCKRFFP